MVIIIIIIIILTLVLFHLIIVAFYGNTPDEYTCHSYYHIITSFTSSYWTPGHHSYSGVFLCTGIVKSHSSKLPLCT